MSMHSGLRVSREEGIRAQENVGENFGAVLQELLDVVSLSI